MQLYITLLLDGLDRISTWSLLDLLHAAWHTRSLDMRHFQPSGCGAIQCQYHQVANMISFTHRWCDLLTLHKILVR